MTRSPADQGSASAPPKRVLIIRLSAIGDVVFASPLVASIKRTYPESEVYWLAESNVAPLLAHDPDLSEVLVWRREDWRALFRSGRWWQLIQAIRIFRRSLRAYRFDLALDTQGLLKSAFLAWLTGAPRRVGFRSKEPTGLFLTARVEKDLAPTISSEYRGLASELGFEQSEFSTRISLSQRERDAAEQFYDERPYVAFCPFTTRPQKHWPEAYWRDLAKSASDMGWRAVVLGAPTDTTAAARMFGGLSTESRVGACSLLESAALVSRASLVIGVDTGLTHMGWAFSVPTIALFGSTCPYRDVGASPGEILYAEMPCSPCRRSPTCGGSFDCMSALTPRAVLEAAQRHLSTESGIPPVIAFSADREEAV
jgi:heptosyltransferase-1